ncbi:MAG: cellulase family glycosylhydrolase [Anaerolineae bacterium]
MKPRSWWALLIALPLLVVAFWLVLSNEADRSPVVAVHTLRADDEMLRLASEAGFDAVVQVFSWLEIEPTREEWHWEYPDFVVRATQHYGLDLIVRLDGLPAWAVEEAVAGQADSLSDDYAAFVGTVAQRYRGQIKGYIVWNEPNLAKEWGGQPPDPVAYTELLHRAYEAIKAADPEAIVVSAGLASTNHQNAEAMDDRAFLETTYQAGAGDYFDALGAHPYGFAYPPDDPQGAHDELNLARLLDLRAIMEAHGDGDKPIWVTELGWTTAGVGEGSWLTVSPQQQADYLTGAWCRARREWPWLQVFTVWNLSQGPRPEPVEGLPPTDEMAGYSLLDESGEPKPAYHALQTELDRRWGHRLARWVDRTQASLLGPVPSAVAILAADEGVHLGDGE